MFFVGRGWRRGEGVWRRVARGGGGCDECCRIWKTVQALPKTLKAECTSGQQKYLCFVFFYIFPRRCTSIRRVLMLWVLVMIWGTRAQSCQV